MNVAWGNPSSLHPEGKRAADLLDESCKIIAKCLNCDPNKIIFTSGGSESDNQAINSAALCMAKLGKTEVISTKIEHPAVLKSLDELSNMGFGVKLLDVDHNGLINIDELERAITPNTALVSIMAANNEIGTIEPIEQIGEICDKHGVLFHTDAVQAVGHIPINFKKCKIDYLSASAHKFYGPKGVGLLVYNDKKVMKKMIFGGSQQHNLRAGTINVPGAYSTAIALEKCVEKMEEYTNNLRAIKEQLIEGILQIPGSVLNGDPKTSLPGTVNFSFENANGESLVLMLGEEGVYVSAGSACHSGDLTPSHVLTAIGRSEELATNSLRISLSNYATEREGHQIAQAIKKCVEKLRGCYFS